MGVTGYLLKSRKRWNFYSEDNRTILTHPFRPYFSDHFRTMAHVTKRIIKIFCVTAISLFFSFHPDYQFVISYTISLEIKNKYFDRRKLWKLKFKENASLWRSGSDGSALDIVGNIQAGSESRAERGRFPWAAEQRGGGRLNFQIGRASRYECTLPRVYFQYARAIKVYGREANNCQAFRVVRLAGWKNRVGLKYGRPCSKGSRHRDLRAQRWCTARIYRAASHVTAARDTHVQNL